jgi:hypothetical protein
MVECIEYQLSISPYGLTVATEFVNFVRNLPDVYNNETAPIFKAFFDIYGHAFTSSIELGGSLQKDAYTHYTYIKKVDGMVVKTQASASFFFEATGSSEYGEELTEAYNESTTAFSIRSLGGEYWESGKTDMTSWASTVPASPIVMYKKLFPIHDLFYDMWTPGQNLTSKIAVTEEAMLDNLIVYGCTDMRATNYNSDATISDNSCIAHLAYTETYHMDHENQNVQMIHTLDGECYLKGMRLSYVSAITSSSMDCQIIEEGDYWHLKGTFKGETYAYLLFCEASCVFISFNGVPI